jgi:serine/threonine protein kinase/tetratricopeptide (TPR) repeat protein
LSAGDVVGKYKILGMAGAGGMGVVYRALDMKLERTVALKFLPEHTVSSPEEKERFLREARFASSLDHPNIGVIHGIEEHGHRTFIVMGYYTGETVAQRIRRAPLSLAEAVEIAIQVGEGLAAAHAGTVVHRDIKPSNIILTQTGAAKIVDFGLARLASATGSTQSVSTAGTIGYMSPEQTIGKFLDQRTDIWSLGIVLAEMVTGKHPFQRETPAATIYAILNEPPLPMDELPLDLLRVIYRALSKEPETRYPNCKEMVADLREVRSHLEPATSQAVTGPSSQNISRSTNRPSTLKAAELRKQIEQASRPMWATNGAPTSRWTWWVAGASVLVLVLAVLSFLTPVRERLSSLFGRTEEHIAVLPFENVGNDPANAAVSDGLMDSLSSKLTNLENGKQSLWVVPASEVRRRKITDAAAALRDLGATMVVEGTLQRDGQTIHMTVNLIDTKTMRQVGSVPLADQDFSTLEDEAVARLAKLMRIDVTPETLRATGGAVNAGAYELYLKALGLTQRYDKAGNLDLAIKALEDAVKTDPRFALGFAQLGEAYRLKYQLDKNTKWLDEALANCQKAQQLDDRLPVVYVTLGNLHHATGKYDLALQEYQRALQLDPRSADAQIGLAESYNSAGRAADAEAAYRKAIALRPDYWSGYNSLANFLDEHQRYPEAIAEFKRAVQLTPDNAALYVNLGAVYVDTGDPKFYPDAEQALKQSIALEPSYGAYANLGYLYIQERKYEEASKAVEKALQLNNRDYLVWGNLAIAYEGLNQGEKQAEARDHEIALLEQEVQATPRDAVKQSILGLLYAQKKVREKAISHLESALALSPDDPNVLEPAGEAYEVMGDRAQAIRCIQKSVQMGYSLASLRNIEALKKLLSDSSFRPVGK